MIRQRVVVLMLACAISAWTFTSLGCGGGGGGGGPVPCTTHNVTNVAGSWVLDNASLAGSNCPSDVNSAIEDLLTRQAGCDYAVSVSGNSVTLDNNCGGSAVFTGNINAENRVNANWNTSVFDPASGCTVNEKSNFSGDLSCSPTEVQIRISISSSDCSGGCSLTLNSQFTKSGAAAAGPVSRAQDAETSPSSIESAVGQIIGQ